MSSKERRKLSDRIREKRWQVILALGARCNCCGNGTPEFLTLDHINEDGAEHRRRMKPYSLWASILKEGCPRDKYQVLCWNCNCAKAIYGYCPCQRIRYGSVLAPLPVKDGFGMKPQ